mgnify:CR=1 FL=1
MSCCYSKKEQKTERQNTAHTWGNQRGGGGCNVSLGEVMYNRRQMFPINLSHWIILSDNVLDLGNNVLDLDNYVLDLGINYMFINQ